MKKIAFAVFVALFVAGVAQARETGIINQAGPYESTMQFYLHPAHGFAGAPETPQQTAAASDKERAEAKPAAERVASRTTTRLLRTKAHDSADTPTERN